MEYWQEYRFLNILIIKIMTFFRFVVFFSHKKQCLKQIRYKILWTISIAFLLHLFRKATDSIYGEFWNGFTIEHISMPRLLLMAISDMFKTLHITLQRHRDSNDEYIYWKCASPNAHNTFTMPIHVNRLDAYS